MFNRSSLFSVVLGRVVNTCSCFFRDGDGFKKKKSVSMIIYSRVSSSYFFLFFEAIPIFCYFKLKPLIFPIF